MCFVDLGADGRREQQVYRGTNQILRNAREGKSQGIHTTVLKKVFFVLGFAFWFLVF